jgi:2,4-dienoyl-CoA reductase-like NADH-dependent reductase (Old Yellow Enzyme family)
MGQSPNGPLNMSILFSPLQIRGLLLHNRIVISPMQQHTATGGLANDWHLIHYGKFALGGAGLIMLESTAVSESGLAAEDDLGLWRDDQAHALKTIVDFAHRCKSAIGVQLGHAGRKGGSTAIWKGARMLSGDEMTQKLAHWERIAPSPMAYPGSFPPREMTLDDVEQVKKDFVAAAHRADQIGFDTVELHFGHGYLIASFLSPSSNQRTDHYGGSLTNRMRFALEVAAQVRDALSKSKPLFCRLSVVDGAGPDGWTEQDSVVLARELSRLGVDVIDCSSGGLTQSPTRVARGLGFQVPYAEKIRRETGTLVQAVGMILDGHQAEEILQAGQADLIAIGRAAYYDPYWPHHARDALRENNDYETWPEEYAAWLKRREPEMREIRAKRGNRTN